FRLKAKGRRFALETGVMRKRVAGNSKKDNERKLYTKSEKIGKEKGRSTFGGQVLGSSWSKVLFSAIALETRPCKPTHIIYSSAIPSNQLSRWARSGFPQNC